MRLLMTIAVLLGTTMNLPAATYLYVSMAPERAIQVFRLNPQDGELASVQTLKVDGAPGSLGVDPSGRFLFASLRTTSTLASFAIDPRDGKLTHLSTAPLGKDENAAFVATDRTGRWLLSASYMGGKVVVHPIDSAGHIGMKPVDVVATTKTAHAAVIDAANEWVFVPHVAPNAIYQFRLDAATGKLTDAGQAPGGTAKAGPRHLAFAPPSNGQAALAFASDEIGNSITAYRFDAVKGLTALQTVTTLPADFQGKNTTAEVKVHPSGKFAWVSNRGHDSLAGFAIDPTGGKLTALGQTPTEKTPRSFEIDPDGAYLFAAGEGTGKLAVYRIDAASGQLNRLRTVDVGQSLTWVMAVKLRSK